MITRKSPQILKFRIKLGKRIAELIRSGGYPSVENFALGNGFNKSTIQQILKGSTDPQLSTLIRLATALEIPLVKMLEGLELNRSGFLRGCFV